MLYNLVGCGDGKFTLTRGWFVVGRIQQITEHDGGGGVEIGLLTYPIDFLG